MVALAQRSVAPPPEAEADAIARAKAGDPAGFEWLMRRHERTLYSFIYRIMGDPDDACDLTQDTFARCFRALGRTRGDLNFSAWSHRIASNACLDVLRRRQRLRFLPWEGHEHDHLLIAKPHADPARAAERQETRAYVRRTLMRMTPRHRTALLLREYEGLTCADIGEVMGLSRSAVKSMLFRARAEFRRVYEQVEAHPLTD